MSLNLIQPFTNSITEPQMNNEIWKNTELHDDYMVSNYGRIKSYVRVKQKILKTSTYNTGYKYVRFAGTNKNFLVHRVVAKAFIPNPENKPEVNHKDGNPSNNHVDNLEWVTRSENAQHAFNNGMFPKNHQRGEIGANSKLNKEDVLKIIELRDKGLGFLEIAEKFEITRQHAGKIYRRESWEHLEI